MYKCTRILIGCVVHVGELGVLPLPVLSPCNKLDMMLGTPGALFNVGLVLVAEAGIINGTGSGRSWSTSSGELHPPTQVCQSRTQVDGFLGGCGGPIPKGLLRVSNRLEWCSRRIQHCSICGNGIRFFVRGVCFHFLWRSNGG